MLRHSRTDKDADCEEHVWMGNWSTMTSSRISVAAIKLRRVASLLDALSRWLACWTRHGTVRRVRARYECRLNYRFHSASSRRRTTERRRRSQQRAQRSRRADTKAQLPLFLYSRPIVLGRGINGATPRLELHRAWSPRGHIPRAGPGSPSTQVPSSHIYTTMSWRAVLFQMS